MYNSRRRFKILCGFNFAHYINLKRNWLKTNIYFSSKIKTFLVEQTNQSRINCRFLWKICNTKVNKWVNKIELNFRKRSFYKVEIFIQSNFDNKSSAFIRIPPLQTFLILIIKIWFYAVIYISKFYTNK